MRPLLIMKVQIRNGVFETNSSSVHAICIAKKNSAVNPKLIPKKQVFKRGDFDWDEAKLSTPDEKASYLYSAIVCLGQHPEYRWMEKKLEQMVWDMGITPEFEPETEEVYTNVNHYGETLEFVLRVLHSEKALKRYLYSDQSFVLTGNDNEPETYPHVNIDYKADVYWKMN